MPCHVNTYFGNSWSAEKVAYIGLGAAVAAGKVRWEGLRVKPSLCGLLSSTVYVAAAAPAAAASAAASAAATTSKPSDMTPLIPTTWNAFQKANKGKGYSPAVMGQMWREYKARLLGR
jgi:hypothetical protein